MYNRALLAVERNNHGHAVLAYLSSTRKYENLYCYNGQPGWLTTTTSRPADAGEFCLGTGRRILRDLQPHAARGVPDFCSAREWHGRSCSGSA